MWLALCLKGNGDTMISKPKFTLRNSLRGIFPVFGFIVLTVTMGATDAWAKGNALGAGAVSLESTPPTTPPPRPGQTETTPPSTALPVSPGSVGEAYAAREASASGLESFKGGDIVVIGSGGLILILLIILIIVLI